MTPRPLAHSFSIGLAAWLAAGSAVAQATVPELLDLSLDELLQVPVGTASFQAVPLREAAASVTVFERRDLERLGFSHLHEVLNWVPGAYTSRVATTGLENRTVLRGNPGTAGGGLLAIDGQRVNTMQSVRAWGVVRNFPLALVERIEVIRGPGGARFGGGPSDEVVNVVTRRHPGTVQASVSSEGGGAAQALLGGTPGGWQLDLRAARAEERSPRYVRLFDRFGRVADSVERQDTRTAMLDVSRGGHGVQLVHHESAISGYYGLNGSINPGDDNVLEATWWRYQGGAALGDWRVEGFASELRQRYVQGAVVRAGGAFPFVAGDFRQRGVLTHRQREAGFTAQRSIGAHALTLGAETSDGRNERADLQANYTLGPFFVPLDGFESTGLSFLANDARDRMVAVFAEDDWRLSPTQRLVLGLRHDRYDEVGSATSPRVAWVWTPGDRGSLALLYQEAFFAPALSQLYLQNNAVIAGAPDLRPAMARTTELVGRYRAGALAGSATLYHRDARDGFVVVPSVGITATTVNASRQHTSGAEGDLLWTVSSAWQLRLTASTIFDDRYTLPERLAQAPPEAFVSRQTASALLNWTPNPQWDANLGAHWRSREGFQPNANDPRTLLQLNWRPSDTLRVWLHADNLFNARGADVDVAGGLGVDPRTGNVVRRLPLPGREWQMGLAWQWR